MWGAVLGAGTGAAGCVERQKGAPSVCTGQGALCAAALDACAGAEGRSAHGITRRQEVSPRADHWLLLQGPLTASSFSRYYPMGYVGTLPNLGVIIR